MEDSEDRVNLAKIQMRLAILWNREFIDTTMIKFYVSLLNRDMKLAYAYEIQ